MRYPIFIVLIAAVLFSTGCTGEKQITNNTSGTSDLTPIDLHRTVDLAALQAKYGIYGSCSEVSKTSSEISQNDAIYKCSDPAKPIQLDNRNCFFNGFYIDSKVRYDIASLSTEVCAREEAATK